MASSAAVTGIISYLVKRYLDKYFKKKDAQEEETQKKLKEAEALKEEKQRVERKNDLVDVVQNQLVPVINKIDDLAVKVEKTEDGTLASLRNDILTSYYRCSETGYRGDWDYENIHHLYEAYVNLHGNSFVQDVIKRFDALPTKEAYIQNQAEQNNNAAIIKAEKTIDSDKDSGEAK